MRDFTIGAYTDYLSILKSHYSTTITYSDYFSKPSAIGERFCILRHDVDRRPFNSLRFAEIESELGLRATYYFRHKPSTFNPKLIKQIASLGHEIGYHYECLSDTKGDIPSALDLFDRNLRDFRQLTPISTICMHGRPLSPYDNRDLWKSKETMALLRDRFGITGEAYLNVDYSSIVYITDTGRNWSSTRANLRDCVQSKVTPEFANGRELKKYLTDTPPHQIVFQIHPERWHDNYFLWSRQLLLDEGTNLIKSFLRWRRRANYRNDQYSRS